MLIAHMEISIWFKPGLCSHTMYVCGECIAKEDHFYIAWKLSHDCTLSINNFAFLRSELFIDRVLFYVCCDVEAREYNLEAALTGTRLYHTEKKEDYLLYFRTLCEKTFSIRILYAQYKCANRTFEVMIIIHPAI